MKNPNPDVANDEMLAWKVLNKIRFESDDPEHWVEFRAYGGLVDTRVESLPCPA